MHKDSILLGLRRMSVAAEYKVCVCVSVCACVHEGTITNSQLSGSFVFPTTVTLKMKWIMKCPAPQLQRMRTKLKLDSPSI